MPKRTQWLNQSRLKWSLSFSIILFVLSFQQATADDLQWLAGAVASEAYSQPFEAQCAIATIVWREALNRHVSVEDLATHSSFLTGWRAGGWHAEQYLHPAPNFITIASYAQAGMCDDYGAKYFDGRHKVWVSEGDDEIPLSFVARYICPPFPIWDKKGVAPLVKEIAGTCFYR